MPPRAASPDPSPTPPHPGPLIRVRLVTFPIMMLASAVVLLLEALAVNHVSSPSADELLLKERLYTVECDPLPLAAPCPPLLAAALTSTCAQTATTTPSWRSGRWRC